jgi:hypothetical protein
LIIFHRIGSTLWISFTLSQTSSVRASTIEMDRAESSGANGKSRPAAVNGDSKIAGHAPPQRYTYPDVTRYNR